MNYVPKAYRGKFFMDLLDRVKSSNFYQVIDLPDGSHTKGTVDHRWCPKFLSLDDCYLAGKRVLDIAANDGFWSFYAEAQGASEVLAIDVETYEGYDWGHGGVPDDWRGKMAKNENFMLLKDLFSSRVKREALSVYDLDPGQGVFDVSFCYGLLYHLRHPLLALDRIRAVTSGTVVVQSHVVYLSPKEMPACLFYADDVLVGAETNWSGPTESCIAHWLLNAGFPHVFMGNNGILLGCTTEEEAQHFHGNPRLSYCDAAYFRAAREAILKVHKREFPRRAVNWLRRRRMRTS